MMKNLPLLALLAALAASCQPAAPAAKAGVDGEDSAPAAKIEDISSEVKTAGAEYLGFPREGVLTYKYSQLEGMAAERGEETTKLASTKDGKAVFEITRSSALAMLGSETVELRKDGVYMVRTSLGEIDAPALTMPADVKVGSKWSSSLKLTRPNGDLMSMTISYEALREEKIKVEAGEFDTLVISGKGEVSVAPKGGEKRSSPWSSQLWHAKGVGHVRMMQDAKNSEGEPVKQYMELVKQGADDKPKDGA
jgi:hypothetical protein